MSNTQSVYYQRFKTVGERFWEKVQVPDEMSCWEWLGRKNPKGYGMFYVGTGKIMLTHRFVWTSVIGDIPTGLQVLHRCDNPSCVNPDHLFLGTNQDNVDDKIEKGRLKVPAGNSHPNSKLSEFDVLEIFELKRRGMLSKNIALLFKVTPSNISYILRGKGWKHVST